MIRNVIVKILYTYVNMYKQIPLFCVLGLWF